MVIIIQKYGQLGNRLFPFAQFIAHAHKHKYRVMNLAFEDYSEHFLNTQNSLASSFPNPWRSKFFTKRVRRIVFIAFAIVARTLIKLNWLKSPFHEIIVQTDPQPHYYSDNTFVKLLTSKKFVFICNPFYFRDDITLHENLNVVIDFLPLSEAHQQNLEPLLAQLKDECDIIVGLHIRGGDFRTWMDGKYFYDIHYFVESIKQMKLLFEDKRVGFLICSNEKWDPSLFGDAQVYFGTNDIAEDLYLLSTTNYLIGGYSSYLYWAALYGNVPIFSFLKEPDLFTTPISLSSFKKVQEFGSVP